MRITHGISVLVILLGIAAATGCSRVPGGGPGPAAGDPNRPPGAVYQAPDNSALVYAPEDLAEAGQVAWVGMRTVGNRNLGAGPLWADQHPERVAHILALVRKAVPVTAPTLATPSGENTHLVIHYRDGREVLIGMAYRRLESGGSRSIPGQYTINDRLVNAPDLDRFYRGVAPVTRVSLVPPVSTLTVEPYNLKPGMTIRITGRGWVDGTRAHLFWNDSIGRHPLGEAPVHRGEFTWGGTLPAEARSATPKGHFSFTAVVEGVGEGHTTSGPSR